MQTTRSAPKALTLLQPFAWAVMEGIKTVENRSRPTSFRGPLLIHAGKSRRLLNGGPFTLPTGETVPDERALVFGALLGTVQLVDCLPVSKLRADPSAEGPYCWLLADPVPLAQPIYCAGQLGLWTPKLPEPLPSPSNGARIFTSNYARLKRIPPELVPVAISAWVPRWAGKIRREPRLAPLKTWFRAQLPLDVFLTNYEALLADLDPAQIARDLGPNAVLICFEGPGRLCHRRIVAEWLEAALKIEVPELGFARALLPTWQEAPLKDQKGGLPWEVNCEFCNAANRVALGSPRCRCLKCRKSFAVTWEQ